MVKFIKLLKYFLQLIRWQNLLLIVITLFLFRYFIFLPYFNRTGLSIILSNSSFFLLSIATLLIAAGGNIINDYFDQKIDFINRPHKVIVGKIFTRRFALILHSIFTLTGIILGALISFKYGLYLHSFIFILTAGLLWFYSTTYKYQLITGNIIISLITSFVILLSLLYDYPLISKKYDGLLDAMGFNINKITSLYLGFFFCSFFLNFAREIVKDIIDIKGDKIFNCKTIPIILGIKKTKIIAITLIILSILSFFFFFHYTFKNLIIIIYSVFFIILPEIILIIKILKSNQNKEFRFISNFLKLILFNGLLYSIFIRFFYLKNIFLF